MKYETIRPLGRGGMGEVFLGRDPQLDRRVAIKVLRSDLPGGKLEARLREEARLLAQLNHPHIVQIFDIAEHGGRPALVMEYVEGRTLHIVQREGQADTGQKLHWLAQIAGALAAAHEAGIVHRDLKAENVLIGTDGTAKVSDFGVAGALSSNRDRADDVLALGRLAVVLLDDGPELSPNLRHLLQRLTHRTAGSRPDAAEAADGFRLAWHESTQVETAPPQAGTRKRLRVVAVVLALVALAIVAGGTLLWLQRPPARTHVAVLAPVAPGPGSPQPAQWPALQSTVQQALQQAVLQSPGLTLASAAAAARLGGDPLKIAAALGADEVVTSTLRCAGSSCQVDIERLGTDGAVIARQGTQLPAESTLQSWHIVQAQWPLLYPGQGRPEGIEGRVDERTLRDYLALHTQAWGGNEASDEEVFARAEQLLARADRFLPLYELYAQAALNLYDEIADPAYLKRAGAALQQAALWAGDSLLLHHCLYQLARERGDFELAQGEIDTIEKLGGDQALLERLRAGMLYYRGDFERAAVHFERALALRPTRDTYFNAANNYYEGNRPERSAALLRESLARYPDDASAHNTLGMVLLHEGSIGPAIDHFRQAQSLAVDLHARTNLGLAYLLLGEYRRARDIFREVYDAGSRAPVDVLNLADAESLLGRRETAAAHYSEVIEAHDGELAMQDLRALAQAYAQLGMHEQAIATLKREAGRRRGNSEDNFSAALVYALAGQDIAALVEVEQALSNRFAAVWFTLPWFDSLCRHPGFGQLMARGGLPGHCDGRLAPGVSGQSRPMVPPGSADE